MVRENKGQKETLSHIIIYKTWGKVKNGGGGEYVVMTDLLKKCGGRQRRSLRAQSSEHA